MKSDPMKITVSAYGPKAYSRFFKDANFGLLGSENVRVYMKYHVGGTS